MDEIRTLSTRYSVEPDLRIGWTSANWDRFARENGAPALAGGTVIGRSLWDFIEGSETRALYAAMLQRVRETSAPVDVAFRCDSPDVRRYMLLHMSCPEDAEVVCIAELLREESRPRVGLLDSELPRIGDPVVICSFCKQVESPSGRWCEVEEALEELDLKEDKPVPPLFNSVCPECWSAAQGDQVE